MLYVLMFRVKCCALVTDSNDIKIDEWLHDEKMKKGSSKWRPKLFHNSIRVVFVRYWNERVCAVINRGSKNREQSVASLAIHRVIIIKKVNFYDRIDNDDFSKKDTISSI